MKPNDETIKRRKALRRGFLAEFKAVVFLILTGHRIVERRFKTASGEIDIIAKKSNLIVIIEVKARNTELACVEAVTALTQRRIHNATDLWLAKQSGAGEYSIRFDIIAITPWRIPKHFKNMF